jgi:hypothetical protein
MMTRKVVNFSDDYVIKVGPMTSPVIHVSLVFLLRNARVFFFYFWDTSRLNIITAPHQSQSDVIDVHNPM